MRPNTRAIPKRFIVMTTEQLSETMQANKATADKLYNELDSNIISVVLAKKKGDFEKQLTCENKVFEILDTVNNSSDDINDCFYRLLIAEYKEKIYWHIYDSEVEQIEYDILREYDMLFDSDDSMYNILMEHYHDPTHYMFSDKNPFYSFYEMVEIKGYYIIDVRENDGDITEYYE